MSWVAEKKAISQKNTSVDAKKKLVGNRKPTAAIAAAISHCIAITQWRFVLNRSTNGLQKGFITHGRYSHPVKKAISEMLTPMLTYISTVRVFTAK